MAEPADELANDAVALSNAEDEAALLDEEAAAMSAVAPHRPIDTVLMWHAIKLAIALILLPFILFRCT